VVRALRDRFAGVRENGARIAERRIADSPRLLDPVIKLSDDADARVRLHAALALGAADDPRAIAVLATIARRDGADRWARAAVFSSVRRRTGAFLDAFTSAPPTAPAVRAAVMQDLGRLFGASESRERCLAFVADVSDPGADLSWQPAALAGVAAGLRTRSGASNTQSPLMALVSGDTTAARGARERLVTMMVRAGVLAAADGAALEQRLAAIELLGQGEWSVSGVRLVRLLEPQRPVAIQIAAVRALGQLRDGEPAASLLDRSRWQAYSPQVRDAVLTTILADERLVPALLDAVARHDISASALGVNRWRRLTTHRNTAIRERAEAMSRTDDPSSPMQVYERKLPEVIAHTGDPLRGAAVFAKYCAACHTSGGAGGHVGPDLTGIRNQPADALLLHIVFPDYEVTPGYEAYTVQAKDERTIVGRLESEAPNSVALRDGTGHSETILRSDVKSMIAATSSLMPAGFGETMSSVELADVIAFLKNAER
jgi:putative heme-binding domain-containing protein